MSRKSKPRPSNTSKPAAAPPPQGATWSEGLTIQAALAQANAYWTAGQPEQAAFLCRQVLEAMPGQPDAQHLMGLMAHAQGQDDLAIEYLRAACRWAEIPAVYLSNFAELCRREGLLAEGEAAARRAVALDGESVGAWNNLGILLQETGKLAESLDCLEQVAARAPDSPEAWNNLANTCRLLDRLDRADQAYARALALRPDYPEALSNRADLLRQLGRLDEAAVMARQAIDLSPQLQGAYLNAAAIETDRQRPVEALRWLDALLAFAPQSTAALSARAAAMLSLDLTSEALAFAERALALAPGDPAAVKIKARILGALGRTDQALAALDAIADAPDQQLLRATLLLESGQRDEAAATLDALTATAPSNAAAWLLRGETRRYGASDPGIAHMEAMLEAGGPAILNDRIALGFALGKAHLDAGDPARAFQRLEEANSAKRATYAYDAAAVDAWMARIAQAYPAERLASRPGLAGASNLPVFVVGMPRSGTTLVEQVLASHPDIAGAGELTVLQRSVDQAGGALAALSDEATAALGERYLAAVRPLANGAARLVDKTPLNFLHAGAIAGGLPGARIIHVRRDPVDACLSCYTKLFETQQAFAYDLAELGRFHRAYQRLMAHWRATLPAGVMLEVDYEALVDDLEGQSRRMLEFLGMDWRAQVLDFHLTRRVVRSASLAQVRQPLYRSSVGRWKPYTPWLAPLLAALGTED